MDLLKYIDFFHDGGLADLKHVGDKIEFSMMSAGIEPEYRMEGMPPLKRDSIVGKLYVEGVKKIKINDKPFSKTLEEIYDKYDDAEILDFDIFGHKVILGIQWTNYSPKRRCWDYSMIKIEAEKIYWENVSNFSKNRPEYIGYFQGGRLIDFRHIRTDRIGWDSVEISMQGAKIGSENRAPLDKKTMIGTLKLDGVKKVKINEKRFDTLLKKTDDIGKIVRFEILDHKAVLCVQWTDLSPDRKGSDFSKIEIESDIIYWEDVLDFSKEMSTQTSYFLGGRLLDFKQFESDLKISMKSDILESESPVIKEFILGKLNLEGIKKIKINDKLFSGALEQTNENGEILDFKVSDHKMLLVIQWVDDSPKLREPNLSKIEIEAEHIYWGKHFEFCSDV